VWMDLRPFMLIKHGNFFFTAPAIEYLSHDNLQLRVTKRCEMTMTNGN
jgi:hypothetical protein